MSRATRVPYHQNLYDLLGLGPAESPEADAMVAAHEAAHGRLPAAVREWLVYPHAVPLTGNDGPHDRAFDRLRRGTFWYTFSNMEQVPTLAGVLRRYATHEVPEDEDWDGGGPPVDRFVQVMCENQGVVRWWVERDAGDDPPVWVDNDRQEDPTAWSREADTFSAFVFKWFAHFGFDPEWGIAADPEHTAARLPGVVAHANRLWLRSAAHPLFVPLLDYLADHFGDPDRDGRYAGLATHTYRPDGGVVRLTVTDPPADGSPAALWVHAQTPEALAAIARPLYRWELLRDTLVADTDVARAAVAGVS